MTDRSVLEHASGAQCGSMNNRWISIVHGGRMPGLWPGEYQNPADADGTPHRPWSLNLAYTECCTGTPCADETRASAFVATKRSPADIAKMLLRTPSFRGRALRVQCDDGGDVIIVDGSSTLFSIQRKDDSGVGGTICTITALSSTACAALASNASKFKQGCCTLVPHGRFESTIQTKLGPKRLVRVVGINEDATDSERLAAHFTIEDDDAVAYQPSPDDEKYTLADSVIARGVLAFWNGGEDCSFSPTIESIVARRDYHGHGLARCLFHAVEKWLLCEWALDTKEGGRMMQATGLCNIVVDGVPTPAGGDGGKGGEAGTCHGLTAVTDKELLYDTLDFIINLPGQGTYAEMMSVNHRKEDEGVRMYPPTAFGSREGGMSNMKEILGIGWRSCDYCLKTESMDNRLKVCTGCVCERYFAGRYCSKRCQKADRGTHKLVCGKTRSEISASYSAFCNGNS